jgi:hypothetical protein
MGKNLFEKAHVRKVRKPEMYEHVCPTCGITFLGAKKKKFCCKEHWSYDCVCDTCGKEFKGHYWGARYCSDECLKNKPKKTERMTYGRCNEKMKEHEGGRYTYDTVMILITSLEGRRKQTLEEIARDLNRPIDEFTAFYERIKADGTYDKVKRNILRRCGGVIW